VVVCLVDALLALIGTVAGDGVDVDDGLVEEEERVGILRRVQVEPVVAVDAATSSDAYGQNGER